MEPANGADSDWRRLCFLNMWYAVAIAFVGLLIWGLHNETNLKM